MVRSKTMCRLSGDHDGIVVAAGVVRELKPLQRPAGNIHHVDVLAAGGARAVFAVPGEGEPLAVRRPRGRNRIAAVGHALNVGAILVHGVDLRQAGAAADPGNLRVRARIPSGRDIGPAERCDLVRASAAGIA